GGSPSGGCGLPAAVRPLHFPLGMAGAAMSGGSGSGFAASGVTWGQRAAVRPGCPACPAASGRALCPARAAGWPGRHQR
ncbi:hypothetical protein KI387_021480, partial [Taxus chinensis]